MTASRVSELTDGVNANGNRPVPQNPPLIPPASVISEAGTSSAESIRKATQKVDTNPNQNTTSSQRSYNAVTQNEEQSSLPTIVLVAIVGLGIWLTFKYFVSAGRKQRLIEEKERLVQKYGDAIALRILSRQVWQGMTEEQLIDSWGGPVDKDREVKGAKTKETWKYNQTGKNRFKDRIYLENGVVVGWKE